jgi:hypothetical protein
MAVDGKTVLTDAETLVVRYTLIEMAWRLAHSQPDYPPIKKLRKAILSRRGRRRFIVGVARRLAIDLWRWARCANFAAYCVPVLSD